MYHSQGQHDDGGEFDLKSRHGCTDLLCCVLFLVSLVAFGILYAMCMAQGNIGRLYHGINNQGQICGIDPPVINAPYLYWCPTSLAQGTPVLNLANPICVSSCPGSVQAASAPSPVFDIEPDCQSVSGPEGMTSYKTVVLLNRYCIPDPMQYPSVANQITDGQLSRWDTNIIEEISSIPSAWPVLVASFFVAIVLGYLYLVLLRHCAAPLIWLSMLLCIVGSGLLGIYLWINAGKLSSKLPDGTKMPEGIDDNEVVITRACAGACWLLAFGVICLACCFKHSVEAASACVECACDAMFEMPSLLVTPVLKALFKGIVVLVLANGFLLLYSTADISEPKLVDNGITRSFEFGPKQYWAILFYMLMSFWILAWLNALYQFIVAYAIAEYYYTPYDHDMEKDVGCCAIKDGLEVGLLYHGGSLAFGALLIAVLQVLQKVIEYAEHKNKETANSHVVSCLLCCCACCVNCCKDIVEFVNKNAYIDMAVTSHNFCDAAKEALEMIVTLGGSMAILNGATFVFSTFGCIIITLATGAFTYVVSSQGTFADQASEFHVDNPVVAMVASMVIGFLVALSFMNIFDMTSDTLLYCYGIDLHNGKGGFTAPPALKELVHSDEHADSGSPQR